MKVLVTGASGMLGNSVTAALRDEPVIDVIAVSGRDQANFEDDAETRAVLRFVRPDVIIHLAASVFGLGGNLQFPADIYKKNIRINTNIIDAAQKFGVKKIVAAGTTAIYSDSASLPFREDECLFGEPHHSEYAYAMAKRAMLVQLRSYKEQYGLDYAYAIITNMYGPHDSFDPNTGHVVPSLISKFLAAEAGCSSVEVWGDGSPTRDFLYSRDAARALVLLMKSGSGAYNIASGNSYTIRELVLKLEDLFPGVAVSWNHNKPNGQRERSYDIRKMGELGFKPHYDLAEGVRDTVEWCRREGLMSISKKRS
jgi:GDP-L-fucose synthase